MRPLPVVVTLNRDFFCHVHRFVYRVDVGKIKLPVEE